MNGEAASHLTYEFERLIMALLAERMIALTG